MVFGRLCSINNVAQFDSSLKFLVRIEKISSKLTIPLKEAAGLLWDFYRDPLQSLTLLSLNVPSQKS